MDRAVTWILLCTILSWADCIQDDVVQTNSGPIKGVRHVVMGKNIHSFLGIPYAKPPVGPLRFKRPQPVSPWNEVLHAFEKPVACPQVTDGMVVPWADAGSDASEDCLYLNIWAPRLRETGEKKAVMFFIHGGGFFCGSSRLDMYDGSALAVLGDVVVVTVNYRLGALGFLYLEDEDCPGNQGLYDQNLALKWVKVNIDAFGGDPTQITIFGESAGSISTGMHLLSPLSQPLLRRAILESCSPNQKYFSYSTEDAVKFAEKVAETVGCGESVLQGSHAVIQCLHDTDAFDIVRADRKLREAHETLGMAALPVYGDEFLPTDPSGDLQPEDVKQTELLVGITEKEGSILLPVVNFDLFDWYSEYISYEEGQANLTKVGENVRGCDWKKAKDLYLKNRDEDIRVSVGQAIADYMVVCPSVYFAEQFSDFGGSVYFFLFSHRPSNSIWPEWMGCSHFDEIEFVFGVPLLKPQDYSEEDVAVSKVMINIWSTFAKTGSPPARGKIPWPNYTSSRPVVVDISARGLVDVIGPRIQQCNFWRCDMARSRANPEQCDAHHKSCSSGNEQHG